MDSRSEGRTAGSQSDQIVRDILKAADGWAREAPEPLRPCVRAVCIRLGEMIADQRNFFAPLPEPQETERAEVLALVARQLASAAVSEGLERELQTLTEMELRSTSSWALQPAAQAEWTTTAITFLEDAGQGLSGSARPDPYWADDVVAGVVASVRAVLGVDDLHARTEAQYPGQRRTGEHAVPTEMDDA